MICKVGLVVKPSRTTLVVEPPCSHERAYDFGSGFAGYGITTKSYYSSPGTTMVDASLSSIISNPMII
jgi:hypothetical protein